MFCTSCGSQIPDGSMFCTVCGAKIAQAPQPLTVEDALNSMSQGAQSLSPAAEFTTDTFCTKCGRKVPAGYMFCTGCGNKIEAPEPEPYTVAAPVQETASVRFCTNCGSPVPDGYSFCTTCGAKVEEAVQETYTVEEPVGQEPTVNEMVGNPTAQLYQEADYTVEEPVAPIEEVPEQIEEIPEQTIEVPEQTIEVPAQTIEVPEQPIPDPIPLAETPAPGSVDTLFAEPEKPGVFCTACGTQIPGGYSFCPNCGAKAAVNKTVMLFAADPSSENKCTNCGATVPRGYDFCTKCGTKLQYTDTSEFDVLQQELAAVPDFVVKKEVTKEEKKPKKKKKGGFFKKLFLFLIILILIAAAAAAGLWFYLRQPKTVRIDEFVEIDGGRAVLDEEGLAEYIEDQLSLRIQVADLLGDFAETVMLDVDVDACIDAVTVTVEDGEAVITYDNEKVKDYGIAYKGGVSESKGSDDADDEDDRRSDIGGTAGDEEKTSYKDDNGYIINTSLMSGVLLDDLLQEAKTTVTQHCQSEIAAVGYWNYSDPEYIGYYFSHKANGSNVNELFAVYKTEVMYSNVLGGFKINVFYPVHFTDLKETEGKLTYTKDAKNFGDYTEGSIYHYGYNNLNSMLNMLRESASAVDQVYMGDSLADYVNGSIDVNKADKLTSVTVSAYVEDAADVFSMYTEQSDSKASFDNISYVGHIYCQEKGFTDIIVSAKVTVNGTSKTLYYPMEYSGLFLTASGKGTYGCRTNYLYGETTVSGTKVAGFEDIKSAISNIKSRNGYRLEFSSELNAYK